MRKRARWMSILDDTILEFLAENGNHQPLAMKKKISESSAGLEYSTQHYNDRCRKLARAGLLQNVGGGTYSLTSRGREYLDGEFDVASIDEPSA